jgi:hypothetical protein
VVWFGGLARFGLDAESKSLRTSVPCQSMLIQSDQRWWWYRQILHVEFILVLVRCYKVLSVSHWLRQEYQHLSYVVSSEILCSTNLGMYDEGVASVYSTVSIHLLYRPGTACKQSVAHLQGYHVRLRRGRTGVGRHLIDVIM